jgi:hypothetical protein
MAGDLEIVEPVHGPCPQPGQPGIVNVPGRPGGHPFPPLGFSAIALRYLMPDICRIIPKWPVCYWVLLGFLLLIAFDLLSAKIFGLSRQR